MQLALDPKTFRYYVIEVNPRVSRSSALASKATGYPIARVAAKIAVGLRLDEIQNAVTKRTLACFEPALDYVVLKIPRWPFDKFNFADRRVGTQMKATGEVMSIDRTFEGALLKAVRSLEIGQYGLTLKGIGEWTEMKLEEVMRHATDQRLFAICEGFRRGMDVEEIHQLTNVDPWFLKKVKDLVDLESEFRTYKGTPDEALLRRAKTSASTTAAWRNSGASKKPKSARCARPMAFSRSTNTSIPAPRNLSRRRRIFIRLMMMRMSW